MFSAPLQKLSTLQLGPRRFYAPRTRAIGRRMPGALQKMWRSRLKT